MKSKRIFAVGIIFVTVLSMSVVTAPTAQAAASTGDLIKIAGTSSVYYLTNGKRYVFPNEQIYFSWYSDFSGVKTISKTELASYPLGANITIRPGTKLVKITTDPKVWAVAPNGELKWISSEATAATLYGADWAKRVIDMPDSFIGDYRVNGVAYGRKTDADVATSKVTTMAYPQGSLVKYAGSTDIYYINVDGSASKITSSSAFSANRFKWSDVVTAQIDKPAESAAISGKVPALVQTYTNTDQDDDIVSSLVSIAITTPATKTIYQVGDSLSVEGLAVSGKYSDQTTKILLISAANITGFNSSAPIASQTLTITYSGKTATYKVKINAASALSSIAITTPATKTIYQVGDSLSVEGLAVSGKYSDQTTKILPISAANITGFDSSAPDASQALTITYGGKTAAYTIKINAAPVVPSLNSASNVVSVFAFDEEEYNKISLSWRAASSSGGLILGGYRIYRDGSKIYDLAATANSIIDYANTSYGFNANTQYCYVVEAHDSTNQYFASSTPSCVITPQNSLVPTPTNAVATMFGPTQVKLTWDSGSQSGLSYVVQRLFIYGWRNIVNPTSETAQSFIDSDVQTGKTYQYRIFRVGDSGASGLSNVVVITVPSAAALPGAPLNFKAVVSGQSSMRLNWVDNSDNEDGFKVESFNSAANSWQLLTTQTSNWGVVYLSGLQPSTTYRLRLYAYNGFGSSLAAELTTATLSPPAAYWTAPDPAKHLLVVYNLASPESAVMKDYYLTHRPGITSANVLGVTTATTEIIDGLEYKTTIQDPVINWLQSHPDKPIRYIVLVYGMPSRTIVHLEAPYYGSGGVGQALSECLLTAGLKEGAKYHAPEINDHYASYLEYYQRFTPEYYQGTTALVTSLDTGSVDSTKAYIDKLASVYSKMAHPNVVISGQDAGILGSTYYFDDAPSGVTCPGSSCAKPGQWAKDAVLYENSQVSVVSDTINHIVDASNVRGYLSWGANGGLGAYYPTDGTIKFQGNSSWYMIQTNESFNGQKYQTGQGNFVRWFSANAFSGANYANTPVIAVSHVEEPGGIGNTEVLFGLWERGYLSAEAAYLSYHRGSVMVIGDPLITK
ncbi:MAG: bacterial Ig-like domain-containing protein [Patescibacteria group bacterium]|nr:bacterial Ig-like domain-containing protein [Patescibacteria group bacterium]